MHRDSAEHFPGLGNRRHARYRAAFDRADEAGRSGFPLEGIVIVDSLLTDRLASRLGYLTKKAPSERLTCGALCAQLLRIEPDAAFCEAVRAIRQWALARNHAVHAVAKSLRHEGGVAFDEILHSHSRVLEEGIECLRAFDVLDIADRARNGAKPPATVPGAFSRNRASTRKHSA